MSGKGSSPRETDQGEGIPLTIVDDRSPIEIRAQQQRVRHGTMLVLSLFILILTFTMGLRESADATSIELGGIRLPSMCTSRSWFGVECPGCGLTRSFVALASGDLSESLRFHRVGWLLFLAVVLQIPYRLYALQELRTGAVQRSWPQWFGTFLIVALIGNWLLKIIS